MNSKFNGAGNCTAKKQAQQLIVELSKQITPQQRQSLLNIYQALDRAESQQYQPTSCIESISCIEQSSHIDEQDWDINQEVFYEEFPQDWVRRTQKNRTQPHSFD